MRQPVGDGSYRDEIYSLIAVVAYKILYLYKGAGKFYYPTIKLDLQPGGFIYRKNQI